MTYSIVKVEVVCGEKRVSLVRSHVSKADAQVWAWELNEAALRSASGVIYEVREEGGRAAGQ